jgi:hypothetical protein
VKEERPPSRVELGKRSMRLSGCFHPGRRESGAAYHGRRAEEGVAGGRIPGRVESPPVPSQCSQVKVILEGSQRNMMVVRYGGMAKAG